jgi:hypothetical protein
MTPQEEEIGDPLFPRSQTNLLSVWERLVTAKYVRIHTAYFDFEGTPAEFEPHKAEFRTALVQYLNEHRPAKGRKISRWRSSDGVTLTMPDASSGSSERWRKGLPETPLRLFETATIHGLHLMFAERIILDLCGGTGAWADPYRKAGYDVRLITLPDDIRFVKYIGKVHGILAAPPLYLLCE